jgi:hypothetical protein
MPWRHVFSQHSSSEVHGPSGAWQLGARQNPSLQTLEQHSPHCEQLAPSAEQPLHLPWSQVPLQHSS